MGLLHRLIAPFSIVGHLFNHDIRMYAFPNSGGWYDFGFFLASALWVAPPSARAKRQRSTPPRRGDMSSNAHLQKRS